MRVTTIVLLAASLLCGLAAAARAEQRVALVIGNDSYENVPALQKAVNDARSIGARLESLGFEVVAAIDAPRREMNRTLQAFANRVQPGAVAMVFYAGHAIEIDGENYLLPVDIPDAEPGQESFLRSEAVALNRVLEQVRGTGARLTVAVLDACRDNPFASGTGRSVGGTRGLSRIAAPGGTFVMYSADAGQAALDRLNDADPDPNSVFTRTLLPMLGTPGLDLVEMARQTRRAVNQLASTVGHQQTPAYYDAILGTFEFVPGDAAPPPSAPSAPPPTATPSAPADNSAVELAYWTSAESSGSAAAYQAYLSRFPQGVFADLARLKLEALTVAAAPPAASPAAPPAASPTPPPAAPRGTGTAEDWLAVAVARYGNDPRGPSYDCAKAARRDEILICGSSVLAGLDREMAALYSRLRGAMTSDGQQALRAAQTAWLRERGACPDEPCIRRLYAERIVFLETF